MNARLRSILLTASIITTGFGAVLYSSCAEDKCAALVCANGSVCQDGGCICPSGYEGALCETTNRDRFLRIWQVTEDGSLSAPAQYTVSVEKGSGITDVIIKNFNNYFPDNVNAHVKGDTLYIDPQTVTGGSSVTGIGYLTDDKYYGTNGKMVVKYEVKNSNGILNDYGLEAGDTNPSIWNK